MVYDVVIIGGGIVGLATGWQLLQRHPEVTLAIVEKEKAIATHQTDRNSGVIHSGIYYKPGSAKAINCVKGYSMLLDFCNRYQVAYDLCGKVIIATRESELSGLQDIYHRGMQNGLRGIEIIDEKQTKEKEPYCSAIKSIWVPQTGIIDFREVATKLAELIVAQGGKVINDFKVNAITEEKDHLKISTGSNTIRCRLAIGCSGLYADHLARLAGVEPPHQIVPFRGEFYNLQPSAERLVKGLIYPVPDVNFPFLGVHLTKRIHGGIEAGPNAVLAFRREGYKHLDVHWGELIDSLRYSGFHHLARKHWRKGMDEMKRSFSKSAFLKSLQKLVPDLKEGDIVRSRTGVRAQALDKKGNLVDDYVIIQQERMIHLLNAPSPAATSCLAIAEYIASLAADKLKNA